MITGSQYEFSWEGSKFISLNNQSGETSKGYLLPICLSMLISLIGTEHFPNMSGAVLCLEDVNEPPYRIDRMFWQLSQSRNLDNIAALVLGEFTFDQNSVSQQAVKSVNNHFSDKRFPVYSGLPFGHIENRPTLPVGVEVNINEKSQMEILFTSGFRN